MTNPNDVAIHNGAFLGLDVPLQEAEIVVFPIPWDVTTSYRPGTVRGPEAVIEASYQLDLFSPYLPGVSELKVGTCPLPREWLTRSEELRRKTSHYIRFLEGGGLAHESDEMLAILQEANDAAQQLQEWSRVEVARLLSEGRSVLTLGGDHSVPLGPIEAHLEKYPNLSLLHFDAHADLREAYEGFEQSHASIMFNVLKNERLGKLVQVGIRDVSEVEVQLSAEHPKVVTFYDWQLQEAKQVGKPWSIVSQEIIEHLGPDVYISFDIDGLDPKLCPHTGTPVPGGYELAEAASLIQAVVRSGRRLVGADLVEVAPSPSFEVGGQGDQWDGNVGARLLFQLMVAVAQSRM